VHSTSTQLASCFAAAARALKTFPLTLTLSATILVSHLLRDGHNDQRIAQLLLLAGASLYMVWRPAAAMSAGSRLTLAALGFFLLAGAVSSSTASIPSHAFLELGLFALLYVLAMGVAAELSRNFTRGLTLALWLVGATAVLYAMQIVAIYVFAFILQTQPIEYAFCPNFSNYRFFNHAQTITLPLLLLLYCREQHPRLRWLWLIVAGLWWALLGVLASKGTFVATVTACAIVLALRGGPAKQYLRAAFVTGWAGLGIFAIIFVAIPILSGMRPFTLLVAFAQGPVGQSTGARLDMWQRAAALLAESPWLGIGPMHFAKYGTDLNIAAHLHNWVMQILTEWGSLAFVGCVVALAAGVRCLLRASRCVAPDDSANQTIVTTWIALGAALLLDGLVSGLIVMPVSQLLIVLYVGCAMAWVRSLALQPCQEVILNRWTVRALLLSAGVAVMTGVLSTEYVSGRPVDAGRFEPLVPMTRFWLPGHF
jgi:O-antigen ligase